VLKTIFPPSPLPGATLPTKNHHASGLLYADPMTIDERPHIKYDWASKRLKFSCTMYYHAKQFWRKGEVKPQRCGVEAVFVQWIQQRIEHRSSRNCSAFILSNFATWTPGRASKKGGSSRDGEIYSIAKSLRKRLKGIQGRKVNPTSNSAASKTLLIASGLLCGKTARIF